MKGEMLIERENFQGWKTHHACNARHASCSAIEPNRTPKFV